VVKKIPSQTCRKTLAANPARGRIQFRKKPDSRKPPIREQSRDQQKGGTATTQMGKTIPNKGIHAQKGSEDVDFSNFLPFDKIAT
jgi:hypothetical protein